MSDDVMKRAEDALSKMRAVGRPWVTDCADALEAALKAKDEEIARLRKGQWPPSSVSEALNSGDGTYHP